MFIESAPSIMYLYERMDILLLIFVRIIAFIYIIPIFSGRNVPNQTKIGFAFCVAIMIYASGIVPVVNYADNLYVYVSLIIKELMTGLIAGFIVYLFFAIFYFAGQLIDQQIGFAMVSVLDPLSQTQVPITGNFIYFVMVVMLIQTGGLNVILEGVFNSYINMPIGSLQIIGNEDVAMYFIYLTANYITLGVKVAAPIVGTIILIDISLGILVKAVPQMNVFVVGVPIKLMIGLVMLVIVMPITLSIFNDIFSQLMFALRFIFERLSVT